MMRVWDVHPGYLYYNSLLGQHAEIHALLSVIAGSKKGYSNHPEALRWQNKKEALIKMHDLTVKEMNLRGFNHASPCCIEITEEVTEDLSYVDHPDVQFAILKDKYKSQNKMGRIPLPKSGSDFWAHYKYSIMARGYNFYKEIQEYMGLKENNPIEEERELLWKVLGIFRKPITAAGLNNTCEHLWGYFKNAASPLDKKEYKINKSNPDFLVDYFFQLAVKYKKDYLLQSTIFADFKEEPFF